MSGLNINGRKNSLIIYAEDCSKYLWNSICNCVGKEPTDYNWLRINFDDEDVDDVDDLITYD